MDVRNEAAEKRADIFLRYLEDRKGDLTGVSADDRVFFEEAAMQPNNPLAYACHAILCDDVNELDKTKVAAAYEALSKQYGKEGYSTRSIEVIHTYLQKGHQGLSKLGYLKEIDEDALQKAGGKFYYNFKAGSPCYINLSGANLRGMDLSNMVLLNANFRGAKLDKAKFTEALIVSCNFDHASLTESEFFDSIIRDSHFTNSTMHGAQFNGTITHDEEFGLDKTNSRVYQCIFTGADLSEMTGQNISWSHCAFTNCDMIGVKLSGETSLVECDFTRACMIGARISVDPSKVEAIDSPTSMDSANLAFSQFESYKSFNSKAVKAVIAGDVNCSHMTSAKEKEPPKGIKVNGKFELPANLTPQMLDHILTSCNTIEDPKQRPEVQKVVFEAVKAVLSKDSKLDLETKYRCGAFAAISDLFKDPANSTSKSGLFAKKNYHSQLKEMHSKLAAEFQNAQVSKTVVISDRKGPK